MKIDLLLITKVHRNHKVLHVIQLDTILQDVDDPIVMRFPVHVGDLVSPYGNPRRSYKVRIRSIVRQVVQAH